MRRRIENIFRSARFDDFAGIHDGDSVRHIRNDAEIVRNKDNGKVSFLFKFIDKFEYLRLNRNVQRGRRFVADKDIGVCRKSDCDNYTLTHTARELERILTISLSRLGNADFFHQFQRLVFRNHSGDAIRDSLCFFFQEIDGCDGFLFGVEVFGSCDCFFVAFDDLVQNRDDILPCKVQIDDFAGTTL